jgi:hypothetical protein
MGIKESKISEEIEENKLTFIRQESRQTCLSDTNRKRDTNECTTTYIYSKNGQEFNYPTMLPNVYHPDDPSNFKLIETNYKIEYSHFHDQYREQPKYTYKNLITQENFTTDSKIKGAKNNSD